jgi:methyl-accepting chemotaxis protein
MHGIDSQIIQLVIIGVAALAVVMQAVVLIAILFALKKAATAMHEDIKELRESVTPILSNSRDFLTRVAPKIESTTNDVAEIVHTIREQSVALDSTLTEILARTQRQSTRVDGMVTTALDSVDKVGEFVAQAVSKPVRQISALVASARAVVQSLSETAPHSDPAPGPSASAPEPSDSDPLA